MANTTEQELIDLTQELLDSIANSDWATYRRMCDPTLSAFEPEARGQLVHGMDFHRYYFDLERNGAATQTTMAAPHVRLLGPDVAVVCYVRLIQHLDEQDRPQTACFEETRVWQRQDGNWQHVHFHRS